MPQSSALSQRGQFRAMYMGLKGQHALEHTPVILCEGDSWFSTPLAMNLLDWIVSPAPEDEARGVPQFGKGGLFFRVERSGDQAAPQAAHPGRSMFTEDNVDDLVGWFTRYRFDAVLLSAGGNDFVDTWLHDALAGRRGLSASQAFDAIVATGRYEEVREAYAFFVKTFHEARPDVPIIAHTYDYPRRIGSAAELGLRNLGAAALLKKSAGPWIGPNIETVIEGGIDAWREFTRHLIDGFVQRVLEPVKRNAAFGGMFDYADLRGQLTDDAQWNDEMHPTEAGFHQLAGVFRAKLISRLPLAKR
ncbi:hypothetical protein J2T07_002899 [Luteibacter jiangsuensis]|uniref:GDSL-like lipase/acylhydrolase family protein n=1 Tax=Luteibacter jiangsuensis TaxID=637577 RepID=A0ABT9T0A1_9GAMM|nr:hypothetical protein [Luteibacter jiangsuensis]MDQ0010693.1 hypothetical protein [Luteibacter jiangsuensis]